MNHITEEQRYVIERMRSAGQSVRAIGAAIGKSPSTVSRELKRNCDRRGGRYRAELAHRKCLIRRENKPHCTTFTDDMKQVAYSLLERKYSPEQISGRLKLEGRRFVSHETIYRWIWDNKRRGGSLHNHLRNRGRRYRKRGSAKNSRGIIPGRVDISQRPQEVNRRDRLGDMEIDLVIGAGHKGALVTMNDRTAGTVHIRKVFSKEANRVAMTAVNALKPIRHLLKTMTSDNGREFADHALISSKLELDFFFATPFHSWERGSNENINGLIRQYIPKKSDILSLPDEYITFVENEINNRPRKRFGFRSPNEIFLSLANSGSVAFTS